MIQRMILTSSNMRPAVAVKQTLAELLEANKSYLNLEGLLTEHPDARRRVLGKL